MSKLFFVICLFLNIGNARACFYTSENDSLETERTMKKQGNKEGAKSLGEQENGYLEPSGRTGPGHRNGSSSMVTRGKKMGTDSVRLRNFVIGS